MNLNPKIRDARVAINGKLYDREYIEGFLRERSSSVEGMQVCDTLQQRDSSPLFKETVTLNSIVFFAKRIMNTYASASKVIFPLDSTPTSSKLPIEKLTLLYLIMNSLIHAVQNFLAVDRT